MHVPPNLKNETRDESIGQALIDSGAGGFAHDVDVVVPQTRNGDAYVALAFDRQRLIECSKLLHDRCEQFGDAPTRLPLNLPEAHAGTVKPLLNSLIPPDKLPLLPAPLMTDMLHLGHWLLLEPSRISGIESMYHKSLERIDASNMLDTLNRSNGITLPAAADAVARLMSSNLGARDHLSPFDAASMFAILQSTHLVVHEDTAWGMARTWCEAHQETGRSLARVLRDSGLHRAVRWHALSEPVFDACAVQEFLTQHEFDAVQALRLTVQAFRLSGNVARIPRKLRLAALDATYLPRHAPPRSLWKDMTSVAGQTILAPWKLTEPTWSSSRRRQTVGYRGDLYAFTYTVTLGREGVQFSDPWSAPFIHDAVATLAVATLELDLDGAQHAIPFGMKDPGLIRWPFDLAGSHRLTLRIVEVPKSANADKVLRPTRGWRGWFKPLPRLGAAASLHSS